MVASVILCSVEIVFANDFFIKNKAKSLAVRLVCGATYTQNAGYLLLQTVLILLVALPVGIIGGLCALPLVNVLLENMMHTDIEITLNFHVIVAYGVNILSVSDNLMSNVKYKVEEFTGMAVEKINIFVEGVRVID